MNERIREIMEECETEYSTSYEPSYDMDKFAEMIIKECADVATYHFRRFEDGGKAIKEHFGVEE